MRVAFEADFSPYSGYGLDGIDLALALVDQGLDVLPLPRTITPGLPEKFTRLLQKDPLLKRPDVVLLFGSPGVFSARRVLPIGAPVVGYTMWERDPVLPRDFRVLEDYDLTWLADLLVTCPMNAEAFAGCFPGRDIGVVPAGIHPERWRGDREPVLDRPVRFLMAGVLSERKNPFAVFESWRELKRDHPEFDAELLVHSMGQNIHPKVAEAYGPGITVSEKRLTTDGMREMYLSSDVLVTASRGEGNNKPAMEFMATGGPVIATDWSGHQNFMHRDVGWLLGGELRPALASEEAKWFEVDRDELKAAMLQAATSPDVVARKGRLAEAHIASFTWEKAADKIARRLVAARG